MSTNTTRSRLASLLAAPLLLAACTSAGERIESRPALASLEATRVCGTLRPPPAGATTIPDAC